MAERIVVGRIRSPYGIQGWIWMETFTENPASVFEWTPWTLTRAADPVSGRPAIAELSTEPEAWKLHSKGYAVRLKGYPDRTAVEALVNCLVEVDATYLPALDDETYYWRDLEGCRVNTLMGVDLGTVKTVLATGANDVLVVQGDTASLDQRERLVPFIAQTVTEVDIHNRTLCVDWDPEF